MMAQKPTDGNTISFNGNTTNSEGAAIAGTPGQSSSSQGQSVNFNHNVSQSSSSNNLASSNPPHHETGGFHSYPGTTTNIQGHSVQGAAGQSASASGQDAVTVQSSSTMVTNGQSSTVTQPGQAVTGASSTVTGTDGQSADSGTGAYTGNYGPRPLADPDTAHYGPRGPLADPDTMYATGTTTSTEGQSVQGADGQSASAVGESATSNQFSSTLTSNGQTTVVNQPGQTATGATSTVTGADGQSATSPEHTATNLPGGVTHIDTPENLGVGQPSHDSQNVSSGGLHITNNPDGSHSMTNGGMTMSEDADGTKHISNGSFAMTKGPDGNKTISNGSAGGSNNASPRSAIDSSVGASSSASDFPTQSTYSHMGSVNADTLKAQIQSALPQPVGGWGSSDHVPPDPASGVLGVDKNKLTNPFDSKENEKDD